MEPNEYQTQEGRRIRILMMIHGRNNLLRNCILEMREDQPKGVPMFRIDEKGELHIWLDGYAIVPVEKYIKLTTIDDPPQPTRCTEIADLERQLKEAKQWGNEMYKQAQSEGAMLGSYRLATLNALDEKCTVNERHCTCVALLRGKSEEDRLTIHNLQQQLAECNKLLDFARLEDKDSLACIELANKTNELLRARVQELEK